MKKFIDLGRKPEPIKPMDAGNKTTGPQEKYYPSMHVDGHNEIPGAVGSKIKAEVILKKTSHTIRKEKNGTTHSHSFEVHGIRPGHLSGAATKDEAIAEAMDAEDHNEDGGKVNAQSMITSGLNAARMKNLEKARQAKAAKKK